jgi:hypothetical protein
MRGSLHCGGKCAAFGRDDGVFGLRGGKTSNSNSSGKSNSNSNGNGNGNGRRRSSAFGEG